jgi:hypothetical protein
MAGYMNQAMRYFPNKTKIARKLPTGLAFWFIRPLCRTIDIEKFGPNVRFALAVGKIAR